MATHNDVQQRMAMLAAMSFLLLLWLGNGVRFVLDHSYAQGECSMLWDGPMFLRNHGWPLEEDWDCDCGSLGGMPEQANVSCPFILVSAVPNSAFAIVLVTDICAGRNVTETFAGDNSVVLRFMIKGKLRKRATEAPKTDTNVSSSCSASRTFGSFKGFKQRLPEETSGSSEVAGDQWPMLKPFPVMLGADRLHEALLPFTVPTWQQLAATEHQQLGTEEALPQSQRLWPQLSHHQGDDQAADAQAADGVGDSLVQQAKLPPHLPPQMSHPGGDDQVSDANAAHGWKSEAYAVRRPIINDIFLRLQLKTERPTVDCFAEETLHVCQRWWGPSSTLCSDAFSTSWAREREPLLWVNPPFSQLGAVVSKLIRDAGRAILIMPNWRSFGWFAQIQPYVVKKYLYPTGTRMFEDASGPMPGLKWPCWALLVDCGREPDPHVMLHNGSFPRTKSSTRRWRKKFKMETMC